jgi:hypothetical protein
MGRGRWKPAVRFDLIAAIKTDSQLEYSRKYEIVRSLEKKSLRAVYIKRVDDSRRKSERIWQQEMRARAGVNPAPTILSPFLSPYGKYLICTRKSLL